MAINDNTAVYLRSDTPVNEARYRVRFYVDPNTVTMASSNQFTMLRGFNAAGTSVVEIEMRRTTTSYQVRGRILNDGTTWSNTNWVTISDAPHYLEFDWRASTAVGANNGGLTFWIDGIQSGNLIAIDNDTRRIESVRLGLVAGIDTGTRGNMFFDGFVSRRQTYIGPEVSADPVIQAVQPEIAPVVAEVMPPEPTVLAPTMVPLSPAEAYPNQPPAAGDDMVSTASGVPVIIHVWMNDTDPENGEITFALVAQPLNGVVVNNGDGTFTYTNHPEFSGQDAFMYQACDLDGLCDMAAVTVIVSPPSAEGGGG